MQVTQTSAEGLKHEFKVIVPAGQIETKVKTRLTEVGPHGVPAGLPPGQGADAAAAQALRRVGDGRGCRGCDQ